jgi:hypothetical protein
MRNNPTGRSLRLRRGGSRKSRKFATHLPPYLAMLFDLRCLTASLVGPSLQEKNNGRQSTSYRIWKDVGYMSTEVTYDVTE